ncbi:MAG: DUF4253 domain-containing protein [Paludibacteraceae bacterium]|nr:DUF4253 domain-containing protein [Paludibacteraceae bacterium]
MSQRIRKIVVSLIIFAVATALNVNFIAELLILFLYWKYIDPDKEEEPEMKLQSNGQPSSEAASLKEPKGEGCFRNRKGWACVIVFLLAMYFQLDLLAALVSVALCWCYVYWDERRRAKKKIQQSECPAVSPEPPLCPASLPEISIEIEEEKPHVAASKEIGALIYSLLNYQRERQRAQSDLLGSLLNRQLSLTTGQTEEREVEVGNDLNFVEPSQIEVDTNAEISGFDPSTTNSDFSGFGDSSQRLALLTGCECVPVRKEQMSDLFELYNEYRMDGKSNGYTPMVVAVDDFVLQILKLHVANKLEDEAQIKASVEAYHAKMLDMELADGKKLLAEILEDCKKCNDTWESFSEMPLGGSSEDKTEETLFNVSSSDKAYIVKVPVSDPWKIWAYVPFGDWSSCPSVERQMAISKYWYEAYGAVPAVVSGSHINFVLSRPAYYTREAALEQYAYCPDILEQGCHTIVALEYSIRNDKVWRFGWK